MGEGEGGGAGGRAEKKGLAYRDLEHELLAIVVGLKGVENGRELVGVELDCRRRQLCATRGSRQQAGRGGVETLY